VKASQAAKEGMLDSQSMASIIGTYYICKSCLIVDQDNGRSRYGHKCNNCGAVSAGGRIYFHLPILTLIDLIKDFYLDAVKGVETGEGRINEKSRLAVAIFYNTLGEVLMENFLVEHMKIRNIPDGLQNRMLSDNQSLGRRVGKLFPSLIEVKFKKALEEIDGDGVLGYQSTMEFFNEVDRKRNDIVHNANQWTISQEMADQCFDSISSLLSIFVGLHNTYNQVGRP
jgi:hypothetical protein